MTQTTHTCACGAVLRFRQDLEKDSSARVARWHCRECRTPVPGLVAEKLKHQHPS